MNNIVLWSDGTFVYAAEGLQDIDAYVVAFPRDYRSRSSSRKKISAGKILEIPKYRQISHQVTLDAGSTMISGKIPKSTKFERLFPFRLRKGSKQ